MQPIDLGDGLILRRTTSQDTALAAFYMYVFRDDSGELLPDVQDWTLDLLSGNHPTFAPDDFLMVMKDDQIVSALCLINQTWTYEGIPFGVGRPEIVGTHPDYRNRGLVRKQFEIIHQWGAERGHKMQTITGIPFYYRQFGYEMALSHNGGRAGYLPHVPKLKEGEAEAYTIRPATEDDIPLLVKLSAQRDQRQPIASPMDATYWRYVLTVRRFRSIPYFDTRIIQSKDGEAVGYLTHTNNPKESLVYAMDYEILPGTPWYAVTPCVVRYLMAIGQEIAGKPMDGFGLVFVDDHPAYELMRDTMPEVYRPYAWYIRIPDLLDFLRHITPALEDRLARSAMVGYSDEMKLSFYRDGLKILFEKGCIKSIEPWQPTPDDRGSAAFPGLTFLQLLMGYRSRDDLRTAFPDTWSQGMTIPLLRVLFPRKQSMVWGIA